MLLFTLCLEVYLRCIKIALIVPLSQSLTGAINQAKHTVKVKRPTLLLHKFAGACEVINWRGSMWSRPSAGHLVLSAVWSANSKLFLETKLNFLRSDFGYWRQGWWIIEQGNIGPFQWNRDGDRFWKKNSNLCGDTADFTSPPPYLVQAFMQSPVIDMCTSKVLHWQPKNSASNSHSWKQRIFLK